MFTKEQLQGIIVAMGNPQIEVYRDDTRSLGYAVRPKIVFRANAEFLAGIKRSLRQHEIECKVKEKESKSRPRPILSVSGKDNCYNMLQLLPNTPTYHDWEDFEEVILLIDEGRHTTREGFDEILRIKGLL